LPEGVVWRPQVVAGGDSSAGALPLRLLLEGRRWHARIRAALDDELADIGLTATQYLFLAELEARPSASGVELAQRLLMSPQTVNPMLTRLERQGWVARQKHGALRPLRVEVTPEGLEKLAEAKHRLAALGSRLLERQAPGTWSALLNLLNTSGPVLGALDAPGAILVDEAD
jgi:DNA-binding MarR family transcriptional regulator